MKRLLLVLLFIPLVFSAVAQDTVYSSSGKPVSQYREKERERKEEKGFNTSKLIFGGGFTLGGGNGMFNVGVSPIIGYRITDNFSAGVGLGYLYLSVKNYFPLRHPVTLVDEYHPLRISMYTGSIWARYVVWNNIFVHAEPEMNFWTAKRPVYEGNPPQLSKISESFTVPRMLVGGGVRQPVSDRSSIVFMLLYDVIQDKNSPYSPLDIRFGFNVGF